MGTRGKLTPFDDAIKINLQKLVDICGYELGTKLQNFPQKDLTEVKIFLKVLGVTFLNTLYMMYLSISRPTQPFILTGSINRVPTCPVGVKAGRSPLSGGR